MNIGIFGGTFNPIHNGHLIVAEMAREEYKLNKIFFVPTANPPHKTTQHLAPAKDRYTLVAMAIQNNPYFCLSPFEMHTKHVYAYQTITYFQTLYPHDRIFYIIGSDSLGEIHTWKKGIALLDMCTFLVFPRLEESRAIPEKLKRKVSWISMEPIGISSTMIRERLKKGKTIRYLVPTAVETYLCAKRIYRLSLK